MKRIVVGVDGSVHSHHALAWAAEEAKLRGAVLHLVHSWRFPPVRVGDVEHPPRVDLEEAAEKVLDDALASLGSVPGVEITREICDVPPTAGLIAASERADLLVVGARGTGGFLGLHLGSVSSQVTHHARCPVVIVPGAARD
jgi:nucleotide-binding universal stress UspA family protein